MKLGERIIQLREAKGWTTNRLANQCGLSQSFLRAVELGEKSISVDNLELLCQALEINLKGFFDTPGENELDDESLCRQVRRLNQEQRAALASFLRTMLDLR